MVSPLTGAECPVRAPFGSLPLYAAQGSVGGVANGLRAMPYGLYAADFLEDICFGCGTAMSAA